MSGGILDGFQTIIPTAATVLSEKRQILRLTQQEVADRAKITLRQSAERKCRICCVSVTFISVFDGTSFSGDRTKLSAGVFYKVVYIGHTRGDSETVGRASTEEFPWSSIWCR